MSVNVHCSIAGCTEPAHARGYCRKHYGRYWRKKPLVPPDPLATPPPAATDPRIDVKALQRQLESSRHSYDLSVGLEARMRWGRKVRELQATLNRVATTTGAAKG